MSRTPNSDRQDPWLTPKFGAARPQLSVVGFDAMARDLVVTAAFGPFHPDVPEGYVGVIASPDGNRSYADRRSFLVPADEYAAFRERFVVDPDRHVEVADDLADTYHQSRADRGPRVDPW